MFKAEKARLLEKMSMRNLKNDGMIEKLFKQVELLESERFRYK
jgi:hypothetical protein